MRVIIKNASYKNPYMNLCTYFLTPYWHMQTTYLCLTDICSQAFWYEQTIPLLFDKVLQFGIIWKSVSLLVLAWVDNWSYWHLFLRYYLYWQTFVPLIFRNWWTQVIAGIYSYAFLDKVNNRSYCPFCFSWVDRYRCSDNCTVSARHLLPFPCFCDFFYILNHSLSIVNENKKFSSRLFNNLE